MEHFGRILQILELISIVGGFVVAIIKMGKSSAAQQAAAVRASAEVQAALNAFDVNSRLKPQTKT
jgi:uncharacterized membrane protein YagU involved in acid resistance